MAVFAVSVPKRERERGREQKRERERHPMESCPNYCPKSWAKSRESNSLNSCQIIRIMMNSSEKRLSKWLYGQGGRTSVLQVRQWPRLTVIAGALLLLSPILSETLSHPVRQLSSHFCVLHTTLLRLFENFFIFRNSVIAGLLLVSLAASQFLWVLPGTSQFFQVLLNSP